MNKKWLSLLFVLLFAGIATAGIILFGFPYDPVDPPQADDTGYTLEGIEAVSNANNQFAMDLYFQLSKENTENLFYSPYSISTALAMTYEGANGTTAEEIKDVFYFPEDDVLRPNSAAIYNIINKKDKSYELITGNALWAQKDSVFLPEYFNLVEKYYGGKAANLDFKNENEKSIHTINDFISKQTNKRIKDIIKQNTLSSDTNLVLTNAIYFKGNWRHKFNPKNTQNLDFKITPENTIKTPTMSMVLQITTNYFENDLLQILELPYIDRELSMFILLPKEDINSLEQVLSNDKFNEWKLNMDATDIKEIYLPKFGFETEYNLVGNLNNMGMPKAFSDSADFSKMTGQKDLLVSNVIHKTFISVDEIGTEAAAATAVSMSGASQPEDYVIFNADHPFIFIIQENQTNEILFLGRMVNPSS